LLIFQRIVWGEGRGEGEIEGGDWGLVLGAPGLFFLLLSPEDRT